MNEIRNTTQIKILDKTLQEGFAQLPRLVLRAKGLSRNAKCLYALLLDYAWQKGSCFPGQERLADDLGINIRTVQRDLIELKKYKLINWEQRGRNKTNIYYILPISFLKKHDTSNVSDPDMPEMSPLGVTDLSHRIEEVEYKKKEYKKPLTLANVNENINLDSFDQEAVFIAEELNDTKNIKYYQKLVTDKKKGIVMPEEITMALDDTRRMIRTDQVDGKDFLRNPAAWFVSVIKKLTEKRRSKEQIEKMNALQNQLLDKMKL